jgi:hypothetical protein
MRRFSIRSLTAFIGVVAIGLAALRDANDLWAGMLLLLALAAVAIAMMGAVILRGGERYWWAGFAFVGAGYLAVAFGPWLSDTFQPQLGTTQLLRHAHDRMMASACPTLDEAELAALRQRRLELRSTYLQVRGRKESDPSLIFTTRELAKVEQQLAAADAVPAIDQFQRVGHSLFTLLAGLLGGTVAVWFYMRRERALSGATGEPFGASTKRVDNTRAPSGRD